MDTPLTAEARRELLCALRPRYQASRRRTKKQILNEFVAATGYHKKYALRLLNTPEVSLAEGPRRRRRAALYDEAAKKVPVEVWEVLDRSCSEILKAAMPTTLAALERHQHLTLDDMVRSQLLAMSARTMDRVRTARSAGQAKKRKRLVPEIRRRIPVRTFGDWKDPPPGSMEMDLVAHCGEVNRGSYLNTLVLTDIGSGWTECAALLVRDGGLVVKAVEQIRVGLPFVLGALDVDNGSEFINEILIEYCLQHHIELTSSRPYRKNDQAWIEQKNGDVVRRHVGYERLEGIAAHQTLSHLYEAVRLYKNFFQPSFKLAEKHRRGAQVTKRYLPPATPYERLLEAPNVPESSKEQLRTLAVSLDPVKLIAQIHALRARLAVIAKGDLPDTSLPQQPPRRTAFLTSAPIAPPMVAVNSAPVAIESPARDVYSQPIETVAPSASIPPTPLPTQKSAPEPPLMRVLSGAKVIPFWPLPPDRPLANGLDPTFAQRLQELRRELRAKHSNRPNAFMLVWPQICRRLEGKPNLSASELLDELCVQYPGSFHPGQLKALTWRVVQWRQDAQARGLVIGRRTIRHNGKPRGRTRADPFQSHWPEMLQCLEAEPAQTALELLASFMAKYPGLYRMGQLRTLQRRVKAWRRAELERLIKLAHPATPTVRLEAG